MSYVQSAVVYWLMWSSNIPMTWQGKDHYPCFEEEETEIRDAKWITQEFRAPDSRIKILSMYHFM